jgi:hypothetical protein
MLYLFYMYRDRMQIILNGINTALATQGNYTIGLEARVLPTYPGP